MTKLVVNGREGTAYIVLVGGKKRWVRKGEIITFPSEEEAEKALKEVRTYYGEPLFSRFIGKQKSSKELTDNAENGESR